MALLACIAFILVATVVLINHSCDAFQQAKDVLCYCAGLALLALCGGIFSISIDLMAIIVVLNAWWLICGLVSKDIFASIRKQVYILCCMLIAMFVVSCEYWREVVLCAGIANCLMVFWQRFDTILMRGSPDDLHANHIPKSISTFLPFFPHKKYKPHDAVGFIGNSNMLALFLVPQVFIAISLDGWWLLAIPLLLVSILFTRCLNAFVSLIGAMVVYFGIIYGIAFMLTISITIAVFGAVLLLFSPDLLVVQNFKKRSDIYKRRTIKERMAYCAIAIRIINEHSWFGIGLDNMRMFTPYVQRDLNNESGGKFLDPENYKHPWPNKCHNDYLQWFVDGGLIGGSLMLGVVCYPFLNINSNELAIAFISMLISGMFFHVFQVTVLNMLFWVVLFGCCSNGQYTTLPIEPIYIIAALMLVMAYKFAFAQFLADFYLRRYYKRNDYNDLLTAEKLQPNNCLILSAKSQYCLRSAQIAESFRALIKAYACPDYFRVMWEAPANLANVIYGMPIICANALYAESLSFYPHYQFAKDGIAKIKSHFMGESNGNS